MTKERTQELNELKEACILLRKHNMVKTEGFRMMAQRIAYLFDCDYTEESSKKADFWKSLIN